MYMSRRGSCRFSFMAPDRMIGVLALLCMVAAVRCSLVPALFVFGDTLVDAGNNNFLLTAARANYPPYGLNFAGGVATGRFCDGMLVHDFLASYMGIPSPPPYLSTNNYSHGVNFGSAKSGIISWPGSGNVMSLAQQVHDFVLVSRALVSFSISDSLFYICSGSADVNNALDSWGGWKPQYRDMFLKVFALQVKRLYASGARKFVFVGVGALGCYPSNQKAGHCSLPHLYAALSYNRGLAELIPELQSALPQAVIVLADMARLMIDVRVNPHSYGFLDATDSCCPFGQPNKRCYRNAYYCRNSSTYVFWDRNSTSEAFNKIVANYWWQGSAPYVSPFNISMLAEPSRVLPSEPDPDAAPAEAAAQPPPPQAKAEPSRVSPPKPDPVARVFAAAASPPAEAAAQQPPPQAKAEPSAPEPPPQTKAQSAPEPPTQAKAQASAPEPPPTTLCT